MREVGERVGEWGEVDVCQMMHDAWSVLKSVLFMHKMLVSAVHMSAPRVLFTLADQLGRAVL